MSNSVVPLFAHNKTNGRCAFYTSFGIEETTSSHESVLSSDVNGLTRGCNVPRVSQSIHCQGPPLEVVSHVLDKSFPAKVSDALDQGYIERALLITPLIESLADSNENYPVGEPNDLVISRRQLLACLFQYDSDILGSVILRVDDSYLPCLTDTNEITSWPYLTVEAAEYLGNRFSHLRTNSPSIERQDSKGGMWGHCLFFGADPRRTPDVNRNLPRRTVGELFVIPRNLDDGQYELLCPFQELGLDCAITLPVILRESNS